MKKVTDTQASKGRPSSGSSTGSDMMSGQLNDVILLLHAPDGSRWSHFMFTRLESPPYEIKSISKDLTILEGPPEDDADNVDGHNDVTETEKEEEGEGDVYLNTFEVADAVRNDSDGNNNTTTNSSTSKDGSDSKAGAEGGDDSNNVRSEEEGTGAATTEDDAADKSLVRAASGSSTGTANVVTLTPASSVEDCILYSRACIVFLSPDVIESGKPFPIEISTLNPRNTVFLLLGVEIQEVREFFGAQSDLVFKCRCCHIDGSQVSISDAIFQIVQAYEDPGGSGSVSSGESPELDPEDVSAGGIYHLPSSVQQNRVKQVFPRDLTGGERTVFFLLEHSPEDDVVVEVGTNQEEVPLTQVCDKLYSFMVPESVYGKVSFVVGSRGHTIGSESVRVMTRLDQLREILAEEVDPKALLVRAVGAAPGDDAGLDTALALRLQQLSSAETFAKMFPVEEAMAESKVVVKAKHVMYPSLLHFAADHNLRTFCSELLRYPGMVGAAQAENKDGETPTHIAARKKFSQLEDDLLKFSRRHGGRRASGAPSVATDDSNDDLYVQPSSPRMGRPPPPHRPSAPSLGYVNSGAESYLSMKDLQPQKHDLINVQHQLSYTDLGRSKDVKDDTNNHKVPAIDYQNLETFRMESNINPKSRLGSVRSTPDEQEVWDLPSDPLDSPGAMSRKALKVMGVTEDDVRRSRSPNFFLEGRSKSFESKDQSPVSERTRFLSSSTPRNFADARQSFLSTTSADQFDSYDETSGKQGKSGKMTKFKSFLNIGKIKGKRSSSISEAETLQSKLAIRGSNNSRRGSESSAKSKSNEAQEERDSGSYSDEEKDKQYPQVAKRNNRQRAFKERNEAMSRRLSRRAHAAMNEKIEIAPTLPSRTGRRKGGFKSFVAD